VILKLVKAFGDNLSRNRASSAWMKFTVRIITKSRRKD